jgi:hypothetical protein
MRKGVPGGCDSRHYSCNQRLSGRPGVEVKDDAFAALRGEVRKFRTASLDGIDAGLRITVAIELFGVPHSGRSRCRRRQSGKLRLRMMPARQ